ncbi:HPr family phosphocarrier protein [Litchfieldia salsa]|uniref:Phosphocarrier protein n=1 Tax=Litchfieldia salsa TaxID=930152 RepID=A0A1H0VQF3_9BACI|nr:HPr family phosphocarrier protein [Litchfieldia salsa]SDP80574.1 phosphocarrier protein [Litchfieldia salsa]
MGNSISKNIIVNISENMTIVDLSNLTQKFHSDIFLTKTVNGVIHDINLKSFLGLITLQLKNGDSILVRVEGDDCDKAIDELLKVLT